MVGLVAHDLRAPLDVVQNLVHLLRTDWDELPDDTKRRSPESHRDSRTTTMGELVDDLFDVVRIEAGQLELERTSSTSRRSIERAIGDALPQEVADRTRDVGSPADVRASAMHGAHGR